MSKIYILQKDLPNCRAGARFAIDGDSRTTYITRDKEFFTRKIDFITQGDHTVENNPDWFKAELSPIDSAWQYFYWRNKNCFDLRDQEKARSMFDEIWDIAEKHFTKQKLEIDSDSINLKP